MLRITPHFWQRLLVSAAGLGLALSLLLTQQPVVHADGPDDAAGELTQFHTFGSFGGSFGLAPTWGSSWFWPSWRGSFWPWWGAGLVPTWGGISWFWPGWSGTFWPWWGSCWCW